MENTNNDAKKSTLSTDHVKGPAIILVEPQLGKNIGMCARAMLNCGLDDLRIVNPRDGWPSGAAIQTSSGAVSVIENARVFDTTAEAIADLHFVLATTARERDMVKPVFTPETAAFECHARRQEGQKTGFMFGPERSGLTNEDVTLAQGVLNVPLNPGFSSLNLAQAVLLTSYAWYAQIDKDIPEIYTRRGDSKPATQDQFNRVMQHMMDELEEKRFFLNPEKRPNTERNIRNIFARLDMTEQETRTLHGIIKTLAGKKTETR